MKNTRNNIVYLSHYKLFDNLIMRQFKEHIVSRFIRAFLISRLSNTTDSRNWIIRKCSFFNQHNIIVSDGMLPKVLTRTFEKHESLTTPQYSGILGNADDLRPRTAYLKTRRNNVCAEKLGQKTGCLG